MMWMMPIGFVACRKAFDLDENAWASRLFGIGEVIVLVAGLDFPIVSAIGLLRYEELPESRRNYMLCRARNDRIISTYYSPTV